MLNRHVTPWRVFGLLLFGLLVLTGVSGVTYADSTTRPFMAFGADASRKEIVAVRFDANGAKIVQRLSMPIAGATTIFDPKRRLLYVATPRAKGKDVNQLIVVSVGVDGSLKQKKQVKMAHGTSSIAIDHSGQYLMTASYSEGTVDVYRLDSDGVPHGPVDSRNEGILYAHSILQAPHHNLITVPYVKASNALYEYSLDVSSGKLIPLKPAKVKVPAGVGPRHQAYHPNKPFVYFSSEQQLGASVYKISKDGTLTHLQVCETGDLKPGDGLSASDCKITPDGKFLFTGLRHKGDGQEDGVVRYRIGENGKLTYLGKTPTDDIPWGLQVTPDGKHLLVTASSGKTLTLFAIDDQGELTKKASLPWGTIRSIGVVEL